MARIAGVDIPREKRLEISLTYIYGIGRTTAQTICAALEANSRLPEATCSEACSTVWIAWFSSEVMALKVSANRPISSCALRRSVSRSAATG